MGQKTLDKLIGQQIKIARRRRRLSQENLADKLGLSYQQIQKYEKGKNRISASTLLELSLALDRPIDTFLRDAHAELTGKPPVSMFESEVELLKEDRRIYKYGALIAGITDAKFRTQILNLAKRHRKLVEEARKQ